MEQAFDRSALLIGEAGVRKLRMARVAVFGLGGVGGHAAEALARAGVGHLLLVDGDTITPSNLNRQLVALRSTLGRSKVEVMAERVQDICPQTVVEARHAYFTQQAEGLFDPLSYHHVLDCVDMVPAKLLLAQRCAQAGTPLISAMGAGNKLDPTLIRIDDISRTSVCPLARVMRKQLKALGIHQLQVAYSTEAPITPREGRAPAGRRAAPGSLPFVPPAMGLAMAGHVVRALLAR